MVNKTPKLSGALTSKSHIPLFLSEVNLFGYQKSTTVVGYF